MSVVIIKNHLHRKEYKRLLPIEGYERHEQQVAPVAVSHDSDLARVLCGKLRRRRACRQWERAVAYQQPGRARAGALHGGAHGRAGDGRLLTTLSTSGRPALF